MCSREKEQKKWHRKYCTAIFWFFFFWKNHKKNIIQFCRNISNEKIQFLLFHFSVRFFIQIECNDLEKHDQVYWYCHKMRLLKVNSSDDQFDARAFPTHHIDLFHLIWFAILCICFSFAFLVKRDYLSTCMSHKIKIWSTRLVNCTHTIDKRVLWLVIYFISYLVLCRSLNFISKSKRYIMRSTCEVTS